LREWLGGAGEAAGSPVPAAAWTAEANRRGEHLRAIAFAQSALARHGALGIRETAGLRQQFALALARSGSADGALAVLGELHAALPPDAETLGMLGRVHKDLAALAEGAERTALLAKAKDFYSEGFAVAGDAYCGINAAALCAVLGGRERAAELARAAVAGRGQGDGYWDCATEAEARLVAGEVDRARELYTAAAAMGGARPADVASTKRQCRWLCRELFGDAGMLDGCFGAAVVAVCEGHRVDLPGAAGRFPESAVPAVRGRIADWFRANSVRAVYCSAASGADLLFLECAAQAGIETHVVLPFPRGDFLRTSVEDCGPEWVGAFSKALDAASSVEVLEPQMPVDCDAAFEFCSRFLLARGAAAAASREWGLRALAVWDGKPGSSPVGTAAAVERWVRAGVDVEILDPGGGEGPRAPGPSVSNGAAFSSVHAAHPGRARSEVAVMLGLHVAGYANLREGDFVALDDGVFGAAADLLAGKDGAPVCEGAFGSYVFFWKGAAAAGVGALELMGVLRSRAAALGLPVDFSMCLHISPVQRVVNPLVNSYVHEGRAALELRGWTGRLAPGAVHATERFVDFAALEKGAGFQFACAGTLDSEGRAFGLRLYRLAGAVPR